MATVLWPFLGGLSSTLGGLTSFGLAGLLTSLTITLRGPPLPSELVAGVLFVSSLVTSLIVTLGGLISLMTDLRGFTSIVTRLGSSTSMATIALNWKKSSKSCRCHRSRSTSTPSSPSNTLACLRLFLNFLNWVYGSIRVALDKCQKLGPPPPSHPRGAHDPTELEAGGRTLPSEREGFREQSCAACDPSNLGRALRSRSAALPGLDIRSWRAFGAVAL